MNMEWPVSTPTEQGIDPESLLLAEQIAGELENIYAFLVIRNGFIVSENYYEGRTAKSANELRSITKSFISALIGIAIDKGVIERVDKKVLDFFPEYSERQIDIRKKAITLENLLTMTAGYAYDEVEEEAKWLFGGKFSAEIDALKRPMQFQPGEEFNYDSPSTDLLSVILTKTAKQDTFSFARRHLFGPLGIENVEWEQDPAGYYRGGAGIVMRPRDTAKLGQLYLQNGKWNGQQIVSEKWVARSVIPQSQGNDKMEYGRLWWTTKNDNEHIFAGIGYGGQLLFVVPEKSLIVVANHDRNVVAEQHGKQIFGFLNQVFARVYQNSR